VSEIHTSSRLEPLLSPGSTDAEEEEEEGGGGGRLSVAMAGEEEGAVAGAEAGAGAGLEAGAGAGGRGSGRGSGEGRGPVEELTLTVKWSGRELTVRVCGEDTVGELKRRICEETGVLPAARSCSM